ncbi:MAG: COX15/CtaA family protein [Parvularculaceae bacterium]
MSANADKLIIPANRPVAFWLFVMCALVALMVTVGGATRLTNSGLSIVEWRPVTGAIPPLSESDWQSEFSKYQTIPQYREMNAGMTLGEFKSIYWWEWGHRLLGRLIGVAFFFPLAFFALTRRIDRHLAIRLLGIFVLGGLQGALGWWMVSSGLTHRTEVSQYRLAAHLALAVALFSAMFWLALDLLGGEKRRPPLKFGAIALAFAGGVYLQMILGAFVAGLRAGRVFNTWPLMNGRFIPEGYFRDPASFRDLFETRAAAQFDHRIGAYILLVLIVWLFVKLRNGPLKARVHFLLAAVFCQVLLGIVTVLAATPIALGLAHQLMALIVLCAALYLAHGCFISMSIKGASG